jgi:hypothetical protein
MLDIPTAVAEFMEGAVEQRDRALYHNGKPLDTGLTRRILQHMDDGEDGLAEPLKKFLDNVLENPSYRSVQGLYDWVSKSGLPITGDGQILGYKIVDKNYRSISPMGPKMDNSVGKIVEQDRNQCDEDPDQTCSAGLHFCSPGYLPHYGCSTGSRIVVVKVHPRDVVAFPRDYNTAKGRACRYEVVGEVDREKIAEFFPNANVCRTFDAVPSQPEPVDEDPSVKNFEVGQRWRDRDDNIWTIIGIDDDRYYPINAVNADEREECFTVTGRTLTSEICGCDLIALVEPEVQPTRAVDPTKPMRLVTTHERVYVHEDPSSFSEVPDHQQWINVPSVIGGARLYDLTDGRHFYGTLGNIENFEA